MRKVDGSDSLRRHKCLFGFVCPHFHRQAFECCANLSLDLQDYTRCCIVPRIALAVSLFTVSVSSMHLRSYFKTLLSLFLSHVSSSLLRTIRGQTLDRRSKLIHTECWQSTPLLDSHCLEAKFYLIVSDPRSYEELDNRLTKYVSAQAEATLKHQQYDAHVCDKRYRRNVDFEWRIFGMVANM
jgi:hypothetical protein